MTDPINGKSVDRDAIETAAAQWVIRRHDRPWTATNEEQFHLWLGESTAHIVAYRRLEAVWHLTARLKAAGTGVGAPRVLPPARSAEAARTRPAELERRISSRNLWSDIASACISRLFAFRGRILPPVRWPDRYRTAIGTLETVHLEDGSAITLNTDSRIRVFLQRSERLVHLDRGEAFFVVTNDPSRPFIVRVGDRGLVAFAGEFSARRMGSDLQVLVTRGQVQAHASLGRSHRPSTTLSAAACATTGDSTLVAMPVSASEAERLLCWRSRLIAFRNTPVERAVAEFNRYHSLALLVEDPSLTSVKITATVRTDTLDGFLALLERDHPIEIRRRRNAILLRRRR